VTDDGRYLAIAVWLGTDSKNRFYYVDLGHAQSPAIDNPVVPLLDDFDASYALIDNDGPVFYFLTDLDAPRRRVIAIDTGNPGREHWREVIPQGAGVINSVDRIGGMLVVDSLVDAHAELQLFDLEGRLVQDIELPGLGTVLVSEGRHEDREMFYTFTSQLYPATVFRYDFDSGASSVFKAPRVDFDPGQYVTEQVFYSSRDGTRVPMFLTHRRDLQRNSANPTFLTGYGGFDISVLPAFSPGNVVWLEMGGILAEPNLRGGGEYGEEWHQAGMLERKQNVFDDFIAAAEFLVQEGYTRPAKLAIAGGSNGGLLVGAAITQRPDLFGAALPMVGVLDMLRFHRFTIGWAWVTEYGSAERPEQFSYLVRYSPLHNLRRGTDYPATLVTTADHDDRVVPAHSFKFAAALQSATLGKRPALIRIEVKAGHGAGKPISKVIEEQADRWAFLVRHLDMKPMLP
jgi:prolyl oligopeptidase